MRLEKLLNDFNSKREQDEAGQVIIYEPEKSGKVDLSGVKAKTVFLIPENGRDSNR